MATHKSLRVHKYGEDVVYEDTPLPKPAEGHLLVKVEGSTINPSDRLRMGGYYFPVQLPATMGLEGTGKVVEANGEAVQHWVGKRVSYICVSGSWGEFTTVDPDFAFEIEEDVPLHCAASGVVNPLTVVGMTSIYENSPGKKGIIHTGAASALGRMLNKRCIDLGIPLLNIVRREEQAELLKSEGAKHVLITKGEWENEYKEAIKEHGYNVFFDALGGGPVTETLITNLNSGSTAHLYGVLEAKPLTISSPLVLSKGVHITGYLLGFWWKAASAEEQKKIREGYSGWLKGQLSTTSNKVLKYTEFKEALDLSVNKATEGKITLIP